MRCSAALQRRLVIRILLVGFVAGCLAVPVFHQGTRFLLHHNGNGIPSATGVFGQGNRVKPSRTP